MTIDRLNECDLLAAVRLSTQAGWNQLEADWFRLLALWPRTCFAGRLDGKLVATSTLATYGRTLGWVGMVLVDESHRGKGFGGQILDAAVAAARDFGVETIGLDATDLGRPVYLKRGFRDIAGIDRWVLGASDREMSQSIACRDRSSADSTTSVRGSTSLDAPASIAAALALDSSATSICRRDLLTILIGETGSQLLASPDQRFAAFGIVRGGRYANHLGPVVAASEADATEMLDQFLTSRMATDRPLFMDVPRGQLKNWLPDRGFTCSRRLTRMVSGPGKINLLGEKIFAASGFELG